MCNGEQKLCHRLPFGHTCGACFAQMHEAARTHRDIPMTDAGAGAGTDAAQEQKWVQCSKCSKWRKVPAGVSDEDLGDDWVCKDNTWDGAYAACTVPEEQALVANPYPAPEPGMGTNAQQQQQQQHLHDNGYGDEDPEDISNGRSSGRARRAHVGDAAAQASRAGRGGSRSRGASGLQMVEMVAPVAVVGGPAGISHSAPPPVLPMPGDAARGRKLPPGKVVWAKVEGHDWWPAQVVRRRAVPREVGAPPGGPPSVMAYIPVVFFNAKGIPDEVRSAAIATQGMSHASRYLKPMHPR